MCLVIPKDDILAEQHKSKNDTDTDTSNRVSNETSQKLVTKNPRYRILE